MQSKREGDPVQTWCPVLDEAIECGYLECRYQSAAEREAAIVAVSIRSELRRLFPPQERLTGGVRARLGRLERHTEQEGDLEQCELLLRLSD